MAEQLKRDFDIVVLKVELLDTRPNVRFTLQAKIGGEVTDLRSWSSDTSDMGFATNTRQQRAGYEGITGNLRNEMLGYVHEWIEANQTVGLALWVHLVKPYGVLRLVPWERALGTALQVPILMLPDFIFPPPRESSSMLEVALCGSAPLDHEEIWVHQAMRDVSHRILEASARRTRLHIFADASLANALRADYKGEGRLDGDVFVYDAQKALPYLQADPSSRLVDQTGRIRSPWLLWMREALRGRSIDVMHFACHGYLTRDRGALLFAQSPLERTDQYLAGPVGQTELVTFLTQVGAWSTAFTSVVDNNSEPGLRALADEIAQCRPGPLLMNTMREDPAAAAVTQAYRFLYSLEPMEPPRSTSLFMYCQPYRVKATAAAAGRSATMVDRSVARNPQQLDALDRTVSQASPLDPIFEREETVLPWVASTERFAEQVQLRFQQSARDQGEDQPDDSRRLQQQVTLETLDRLRATVARMASSPQGGAAGGSASPGGPS